MSKTKRAYNISPRVVDPGYPCPHCKHLYDHRVRKKIETPCGPRWYMFCGGCGKPFAMIRSPT